jgi:BirA family biotin operon repressor/biotin-[acetyl-CoA-carboxylase] ligase
VAPRVEVDTLPSTHELLRELAARGAPVGTRVVAREQSAGRGRSDHRWASPPGGLYVSFLAADVDVGAGALAALAAGTRIARYLSATAGVDVRVKWPNDLVVVEPSGASRKLGGVLVDRWVRPEGAAVLGLGIGLNYSTPLEAFPPELRTRVATLVLLSRDAPSLRALEDGVVEESERGLRALADADGRARVVHDGRALLHGIGRRAAVDGVPVGTICGLGDDGALLVEGDGGLSDIRAGDLVVEETA